ncbi:MAG: hypothetical protein IPO93_14895 [Actinobacteria bacterium]|nr:hypothetical protein [Actinomycetota bacterium]
MGPTTRWGGWAVLAGWLVATIGFSAESTSGDLALSGGTRQMTYLLGGVILGSAAATLPLPRSRGVVGTGDGAAASDAPSGAYDPQ